MVSFSNFMELWISTSYTISRCDGCHIFVDFVYNYTVASIKVLEKAVQEVNSIENEGRFVEFTTIINLHEAIAMKKKLKEKLVLNRRAKRSSANPKSRSKKLCTNKPITLEDLTNPDKN